MHWTAACCDSGHGRRVKKSDCIAVRKKERRKYLVFLREHAAADAFVFEHSAHRLAQSVLTRVVQHRAVLLLQSQQKSNDSQDRENSSRTVSANRAAHADVGGVESGVLQQLQHEGRVSALLEHVPVVRQRVRQRRPVVLCVPR